MCDIDLKDRKILYELDLNCRQSNSQIGRKVGLGRNVVRNRIKKLEKKGIIKHYYTIIDTFKLGYNVFRIYLKFKDIPKERKDEIIKYLVTYKNTWVVTSATGVYDIGAVLWVKNGIEFYNFSKVIYNRYSKYIAQKYISFYIRATEYEKSYLLNNEKLKKSRKKFIIDCSSGNIDIDEIDYKILDILCLNARIPLIELAEKLNLSSQATNYRLNKLLKTGLIKAFRVDIEPKKIGLQYFDIRLNLWDYSYRKKIIEFLEKIPYFICLNTAIGYADLELEFVIKTFDELIEIMDKINEIYPNVIRDYHFLKYRTTHKERWLPNIY